MFQLKSIVGGSRREYVEGMPDPEYRAVPALSQSSLKPAMDSMLEFHWAWHHPRPQTDNMRFGSAVHCLLFETAQFEDRFVAYDGVRNGIRWEIFRDDHLGQTILPKKLYDAALVAAERFAFTDDLKPIREAGQPEVSVFMPEVGLQCKGRLDWVSTSAHTLTEFKTTRHVKARPFSNDFYGYGYDVQLGLYRRWLNLLTNDYWPVTLITQKNEPPYGIVVRPVPDAVLDAGMEAGMRLIRQVRDCIEADKWPDLTGEEDPFHVPSYRMEPDINLEEVAIYGQAC